MKKVYFPREVLVVATVLSWMVSFLVELVVLLVALMVVGNFVLPWLPLVLVILAVQSLFLIGVGAALSVLNVYFRDVQHFIGIFLQLWFYATPVVYPVSYVPEHATLLGQSLPAACDLRIEPDGRVPRGLPPLPVRPPVPAAGRQVPTCVGSAAVALLVGYAIFRRFEPRLAEEL